MSNGSFRRPPSVEPHATIGAQDLVKDQPDRCGFLRKRGQKERIMENLHLSRHINWRQKYVVVKDGCCYCFTDELARSPQQAFTLKGYNKLYRTSSDRAYSVFCVEPDNTANRKIHTFAASTESERLAWMQVFRSAMAAANDIQPSPIHSFTSEDDADEIYIGLEKPLYESAETNPGTQGGGGNHDDVFEVEEEEEEEGSDDSDYDVPDEDMKKALRQQQPYSGRRNVPLPPVPQEQGHAKPAAPSPPAKREAVKPPKSQDQPPPIVGRPPHQRGSSDGGTGRKPAPLPDQRTRPGVPLPGMSSVSNTLPNPKPTAAAPPPGPRPTPPAKKQANRRLSEMECFFDNSDREAALQIIRHINTPGTFLIRKSRQGDSKVLVVMTAEDVKEYKIFIENGQVSLDKRTFFPSLDDLLNHYNSTPLPNRHQTLNRSYSSVSSSR